MTKFDRLRRSPALLVPLLCLVPLVVGSRQPESREFFRRDRKLVEQSLRLVDATRAIAAKHRIEWHRISSIAYVPFGLGFYNGATYYRGTGRDRPLTLATARRFWAEWIAAARECGVDRWAQRCLFLCNRPAIPPEIFEKGAFEIRLIHHREPIVVRGARRVAGKGYAADGGVTELEYPAPAGKRPAFVAFRVEGDGRTIGRVGLMLLDGDDGPQGHLSIQPEEAGPTHVDLRRLPWRTEVPIERVRISIRVPRGTVFQVAFLAIAWEA